MDTRNTLKKYFGYPDFRENQEEIIKGVLCKRDVIALLPTGGGKSICYQLPFLHMNTNCLVVSPLIALMEDQVSNLRHKGIAAYFLHSGLSPQEKEDMLHHFLHTNPSILYVSPERLKDEVFISILNRSMIHHVAIDEAHCISQWGHDFRPSYLEIGNFVRKLKHRPQLTTLTATATPKVISEIEKYCDLNDPLIFKSSFARKNIAINIYSTNQPKRELVRSIKSIKTGSKIVYMRSRRGVKTLDESLRNAGIQAYHYHGNLTYAQRKKIAQLWMGREGSTMVATNAFGMGIDKADVRGVYHLDIPPSIEEYYQEIGRAGRDGLNAQAEMILFPDAADQALSKLNKVEVDENAFSVVIHYLNSAYSEKGNVRIPLVVRVEAKKLCVSTIQLLNIFNALKRGGYLTVSSGISDPSRIMLSEKLKNHQLNQLPKEERVVLEFLLKNYEHLFDAHMVISEEMMVNALEIKVDRIQLILNQLDKKKLLSYQPRKEEPWIQIFRIIESDSYKNDLAPYYQLQKRNLETIIGLIKSDKCRMNSILNYFNEQVIENCGICDNCKKFIDTGQVAMEFSSLFNQLSVGDSLNVRKLLRSTDQPEKNKILSDLKVLENEEVIKIENGDVVLLKPYKLRI